ncbi:hypothetical protein IEQ34_002552 [Dendrobium chrysotoxum]|uniref:Uncharacterized protein n=1 Tax=Dendrobium chrysotoxum TaxID=161865 RepID=A0AAV7H586_DENCH|nr:hypothetical protein IEQ34_002552 [Dendrobium chrysotoxum]
MTLQFLAISKFPTRRKEAIQKVRKVADGLARKVEEAMQKDLLEATEKLNDYAEFISKPYQDSAQQRIDWLLETQQELATTVHKLQDFKVEIQNLHVS